MICIISHRWFLFFNDFDRYEVLSWFFHERLLLHIVKWFGKQLFENRTLSIISWLIVVFVVWSFNQTIVSTSSREKIRNNNSNNKFYISFTFYCFPDCDTVIVSIKIVFVCLIVAFSWLPLPFLLLSLSFLYCCVHRWWLLCFPLLDLLFWPLFLSSCLLSGQWLIVDIGVISPSSFIKGIIIIVRVFRFPMIFWLR
jgi:hypothetical protein